MTATFLQIVLRVLLIVICGFLLSCESKKPSATSGATKPPVSFDQAEFSDVTPMLDGSAYAKSSDSRLWYLRGNKAVRVTVLADASQKMPKFFDIIPVLDGSAYATSSEDGAGLWYLHAEHAERVAEATSLTDAGERPQVSGKAFYALYLAEHKKRKEAEDRADNPPEPPDDSRDDYDPY